MKMLCGILLVLLLACSCRTKKQLARLELIDSESLHSEIRTQVAQQMQQLEDLSVRWRETEVKDSAGTTRRVTDVVVERRQDVRQESIRKESVRTDSSAQREVVAREELRKRPSVNTHVVTAVLGLVLGLVVYVRLRGAGRKK